MKLHLIRHRTYGREIFYPACPLSQMICELLTQTTLTEANVAVLKVYGIDLDFKPKKEKK